VTRLVIGKKKLTWISVELRPCLYSSS
jgi:hypothetical protein